MATKFNWGRAFGAGLSTLGQAMAQDTERKRQVALEQERWERAQQAQLEAEQRRWNRQDALERASNPLVGYDQYTALTGKEIPQEMWGQVATPSLDGGYQGPGLPENPMVPLKLANAIAGQMSAPVKDAGTVNLVIPQQHRAAFGGAESLDLPYAQASSLYKSLYPEEDVPDKKPLGTDPWGNPVYAAPSQGQINSWQEQSGLEHLGGLKWGRPRIEGGGRTEYAYESPLGEKYTQDEVDAAGGLDAMFERDIPVADEMGLSWQGGLGWKPKKPAGAELVPFFDPRYGDQGSVNQTQRRLLKNDLADEGYIDVNPASNEELFIDTNNDPGYINIEAAVQGALSGELDRNPKTGMYRTKGNFLGFGKETLTPEQVWTKDGIGFKAMKDYVANHAKSGAGLENLSVPALNAFAKKNGVSLSEVISGIDNLPAGAETAIRLELKYNIDIQKMDPVDGKIYYIDQDGNGYTEEDL